MSPSMKLQSLILTLLLSLLATSTFAQAAPTKTERRIFDVASYATLGVNVALEIKDSWDAPDRGTQLAYTGIRLGLTGVAVAAVKHYFPSKRPCAPDCGVDSPDSDIPSGHMAFAVQAIGSGGKHLAITIPLAASTGWFRILANKHDLLGVAIGAGVGAATWQIR